MKKEEDIRDANLTERPNFDGKKVIKADIRRQSDQRSQNSEGRASYARCDGMWVKVKMKEGTNDCKADWRAKMVLLKKKWITQTVRG